MKNIDQKIGLALLAFAVAVISYFVWISDGFYGGGDSLAHYRLARFSWEHPIYLLDHWGKPFFTLLAMPSTLLGFKGIQFFNLLCGIVSVLLIAGIAKELKLRYHWLAVPIVLFTPIFFQEFFSGLTEACFAMLLLLSIWLRLKKQFAVSLVVMSFLPFVRTEAILLIGWFGMQDMLERKSAQVALLLAGTVLYSLIGWAAKGDILWLINEMPYTGGDNIYGSGKLFHYFQIMPEKIGRATLVATAFGLTVIAFRFRNKAKEDRWMVNYVVIPAFIYLTFHSIMWYVGKVSLGLPRMLAVVVPLFTIVIIYGFNWLNSMFTSRFIVIFCWLLSFYVVVNTYNCVQLPVPLGEEEKVLEQVAEYIRQNELTEHKIHYYSLYNEVSLGLDPHQPEQCQQVVHNRSNPHEEVKPGSLVIWDAHFSPNEGAMPLENLLNNEHFEVLKVFKPEVAFNTLGDRPFEVYLFLRKQD
ncbi:MAG: hypothetical protein H6603_09405 [Flavobacteriales bacterium]|nr:hypothetical protein [Flavobacteriales bacterium]